MADKKAVYRGREHMWLTLGSSPNAVEVIATDEGGDLLRLAEMPDCALQPL